MEAFINQVYRPAAIQITLQLEDSLQLESALNHSGTVDNDQEYYFINGHAKPDKEYDYYFYALNKPAAEPDGTPLPNATGYSYFNRNSCFCLCLPSSIGWRITTRRAPKFGHALGMRHHPSKFNMMYFKGIGGTRWTKASGTASTPNTQNSMLESVCAHKMRQAHGRAELRRADTLVRRRPSRQRNA